MLLRINTLSDVISGEVKLKNKSLNTYLKLHQGTKQSDAVDLLLTTSAKHNIQTEKYYC